MAISDCLPCSIGGLKVQYESSGHISTRSFMFVNLAIPEFIFSNILKKNNVLALLLDVPFLCKFQDRGQRQRLLRFNRMLIVKDNMTLQQQVLFPCLYHTLFQ